MRILKMYLIFVFILLTSLIFMARISTADTTGTIAGTVRAKQSGQPIVGVNVIVLETHWGAATDLNGKYRILSLPEGKYNLKFSHIAFQENKVRGVKVTNKKTVTVDVELEATVIEGEMVMVTPRTEYFDASGLGARLSRKMVDQTPGAAQDIFWVLQTLPGIASGSDNSKLYVRGGSPDENLVIFDGATIKSPFHFDFLGGGFFSIFNSRLIKNVKFYPSGFPARYGDRLSSVVEIENRSGNRDKISAEGSLSMSDVSAILEFPLILNGSSIFSFRRSYFDLLLESTGFGAEYDVMPYFWDFYSRLDFDLSDFHKLTISGVRSEENMLGVFDEPHWEGTHSWGSKNQVLSFRLRSIWKHNLFSELVAYSSNASRKADHADGNGREYVDQLELAMKGDVSWSLAKHEIHFGSWLVRERDDMLYDLPPELSYNFQELRIQSKGTVDKFSAYLEDKWQIFANLTANLGIRSDYIKENGELQLSPRLNIAYAWKDHMSFSLYYGWYFQAPKAYELAANSNLQSKKAVSYGVGLKHFIADKILVNVEIYQKTLKNLPTLDATWRYSDAGHGFSRGIEMYIQWTLSEKFLGWLSYTYSISKRREGTADKVYYFDFDRPHLLSLVLNYTLPKNWQLGIQFRYASGNPMTPVQRGYYNNLTSQWYAVLGERNSQRFPAYHRLDVRMTRRFNFKKVGVELYLELFNTYGRENPVHYVWSQDYSSKKNFTVFPFMPVLGVNVKY